MARLSEAQVEAGLARLHGWRREGDALVKQFAFEGFADAVAALVRLAFEAEAADHHPDWSNSWNTVEVGIVSHDAGGITARCVELARRTTRAAS